MKLLSLRKCRVKIPTFASLEDGAVTIEIVLWVPFFVLACMAGGQLAMIFFGQAVALDAAQQATRAYSIGELNSEAEVRAYVKDALSTLSANVDVQSSVTDNLITTYVRVPAKDFGGPFKILAELGQANVIVKAQQFKEL